MVRMAMTVKEVVTSPPTTTPRGDGRHRLVLRVGGERIVVDLPVTMGTLGDARLPEHVEAVAMEFAVTRDVRRG